MLRKLLLTLFVLHTLFFVLANAASVTASVNTQEVIKGNPVQFSIRATGGSAAFPDIRQIGGAGVTDSGTSTSTSMRITTNGMEKESATIRSYIFVPQQDMTIPSYRVRVGNETLQTKPISIKVRASTAPTVHAGSGYAFTMKSAKNRVVVGESFVLTLYLSLEDRLGVQQVSEYVEPSSSNFFFKDLGKQKQYKQGRTNIIEKQYSITAKKEGNFTISSAAAKVGITDRRHQDLFGRYGIRWIEVRSNTLDIEVTAPKMDADLVGEFSISTKIDTQKVKANKPVNLTVILQGKGNLEDFVFPKYEIDGVTMYEDDAKIESHIEQGELVSRYEKHFVFIANSDFTIPKQVISVYNTQNQEVEVLEVPSYSIEVAQKKTLGTLLETKPDKILEQVSKKEPVSKGDVVTKKDTTLGYNISVWVLLGTFVLGMFIMYLIQKILPTWKKKENPYKESEALKILYAHISEDQAVEEMVRKLYAKKSGDKSVQIDKKALKEMVARFR